ncbi:hypothetical protein BDW68DRAFT_162002 [Aspergillus falconensis]
MSFYLPYEPRRLYRISKIRSPSPAHLGCDGSVEMHYVFLLFLIFCDLCHLRYSWTNDAITPASRLSPYIVLDYTVFEPYICICQHGWLSTL